jgi:hypothetical protein
VIHAREIFQRLAEFPAICQFLLNLSLIADALQKLRPLSKDLQSRMMNNVIANGKIHRLTVVLEAQKT